MTTIKRKRETFSPIAYLRDTLLLADAFEFTSRESPRDTTRHFSQLVCYPGLIFDVGRTTNFTWLADNVYEFDIRHKRYLGRGAYALSARAVGVILIDETSGETLVMGTVRQGAFYLIALILMTLFVVTSYALVPVSILFLPQALLMSGVIWLHWRYLLADRRDLYMQITSVLQI
jgi:hypothetical protein